MMVFSKIDRRGFLSLCSIIVFLGTEEQVRASEAVPPAPVLSAAASSSHRVQSQLDRTVQAIIDGPHPLHRAVEMNMLGLIKRIVNRFGAQIVNSRDETGHTALSKAVFLGYDHCIRILIDNYRADMEVQVDQKSLIEIAREQGHHSTVALLQRRAHREKSAPATLHEAVQSNAAGSIARLMQTGQFDVNGTDRYGDTPLLVAVRRGNDACVRTLIADYKADTTILMRKLSLLDYALMHDHLSTAEILVQYMPLDRPNGYGSLPLCEAIRQGKKRFIAMYLALPNTLFVCATEINGKTAFEVARDKGDTQLAEQLKKLMEDAAPRLEVLCVQQEQQKQQRLAAQGIAAQRGAQLQGASVSAPLQNPLLASANPAGVLSFQDAAQAHECTLRARAVRFDGNNDRGPVPLLIGRHPRSQAGSGIANPPASGSVQPPVTPGHSANAAQQLAQTAPPQSPVLPSAATGSLAQVAAGSLAQAAIGTPAQTIPPQNIVSSALPVLNARPLLPNTQPPPVIAQQPRVNQAPLQRDSAPARRSFNWKKVVAWSAIGLLGTGALAYYFDLFGLRKSKPKVAAQPALPASITLPAQLNPSQQPTQVSP